MADPMEIGWPSNVRHVAHVTFDRFNGFLGLPSEFEPDVPRKAPSASATVFGVSTESMQLAYDSRGNCIPVILLLMQSRLYSQGGLQVEGIFRIAADNSEEEHVREQLNRGVVPDGIDVHCLAGLIKAWFRELPAGILDPLPPQQVLQCETEEDYVKVVRLLPPTQASLLNWAINLMADVVQHEQLNRMNSRNVALVFAPNMSQMTDPLTALMYAVQVMNLLKTLIDRTLRERGTSTPKGAPSDESGNQSPVSCAQDFDDCSEEDEDKEDPGQEEDSQDEDDSEEEENETVPPFVLKPAPSVCSPIINENAFDTIFDEKTHSTPGRDQSAPTPARVDEDSQKAGLGPDSEKSEIIESASSPSHPGVIAPDSGKSKAGESASTSSHLSAIGPDSGKSKIGESSSSSGWTNDGLRKIVVLRPPELPVPAHAGVKKGISNPSHINSRADRSEARR